MDLPKDLEFEFISDFHRRHTIRNKSLRAMDKRLAGSDTSRLKQRLAVKTTYPFAANVSNYHVNCVGC